MDRLEMTKADRGWMFLLLGGGGAVLLALLPWLLGLLDGLPFLPFESAVRWVASFDAGWAWAARAAIGALAGSALGAWTLVDEHRLEVHDDAVVHLHRGDRRTLRREDVVGVYRDGKRLVIDGREGRTLFAQPLEAPKDRVREAFVSRGYPWESD